MIELLKGYQWKETFLKLWDTLSKEKFKSIPKIFSKPADGILFVYSVANKSTFFLQCVKLDAGLRIIPVKKNQSFDVEIK